MNLTQAMFEDVGEAHEDRQADTAQLQTVDQFLEVDRTRRVLGRVDLDVTGVVDGKVTVTPAGHFVELAGVVDAPRAGRGTGGGGCGAGSTVGYRAGCIH